MGTVELTGLEIMLIIACNRCKTYCQQQRRNLVLSGLQLVEKQAHPRAVLCACCNKGLHNVSIDLHVNTLSEIPSQKHQQLLGRPQMHTLNKSSLVIPGFLGTPAGMMTKSAPFSASAIPS